MCRYVCVSQLWKRVETASSAPGTPLFPGGATSPVAADDGDRSVIGIGFVEWPSRRCENVVRAESIGRDPVSQDVDHR